MLEVEFPSDMKQYVGQKVGSSDWLTVDQKRIDDFAAVSGDHNWIHIDRERAKQQMPDGKTIAHGFLTLSLLPLLINKSVSIDNVKLGLNYGLNKVRFPSPVLVDSRLRGRIRLKEMEDVAPVDGNPGYQITWEVTMECEGAGKPACVAENVHRRYG